MPDFPIIAVTSTAALLDGAVRVRLNAAYLRALEGAGAVPLIVPPLGTAGSAERVLVGVDGLVLSGGEDVDPARYGAVPHPRLTAPNAERDAWELALTSAARERGLPTLGICRGMQLLNVALGGTLIQDIPSERPAAADHDPAGGRAERVHRVRAREGSRLARALGATELAVNSRHHQALDRVASPLVITAHAEDGIVEAVEMSDDGWWMVGVQWHPEELVDGGEPWDRALFAAFVARVREEREVRAPRGRVR